MNNRKGNATVELSIVFLPLFLLLLSIIDFGLCLWSYHTLAAAVKRTARIAAVHGTRCADASAQCQQSLADLSANLRTVGVGLDAAQLSLFLTAGSTVRSCQPVSSCQSDETDWPPAGNAAIGTLLKVRASYVYRPIMAVLWPGVNGSLTLASESTEMVHF